MTSLMYKPSVLSCLLSTSPINGASISKQINRRRIVSEATQSENGLQVVPLVVILTLGTICCPFLLRSVVKARASHCQRAVVRGKIDNLADDWRNHVDQPLPNA